MAVVADFAAGDGALLRAAAERWPKASLVATDIDPRVVRSLRASNPDWRVGRVDFLKEQSRARSALVRSMMGRVDLALLNPPFSCRGGTRVTVRSGGDLATCSVAMAFVIQGLNYLSTRGELRAVLPASVLFSQKDANARRLIRAQADLVTLAEYGRDTFERCYPSTVLVCAKKTGEVLQPKFPAPESIPSPAPLGQIELIRGSIPMHEVRASRARDAIPLVHTTDLGYRTVRPRLRVRRRGRSVSGPAVLMPRVGMPSVEKVGLHVSRSEVLLSDCVFALRCGSQRQAMLVRSAIRMEWGKFRDIYRGTCAPYTTLGRLAEALRRIGIEVIGHRESTPQYDQSLRHRD
jgi:predicted RNA methylase